MKTIFNGGSSLILLGLLFITNLAQATEVTAPVVIAATPTAEELFATGQAAYKQRNFNVAADLFKKSADQGNAEAQYTYALMLYRGQGMSSPDFSEASRYYILAANSNFAKAQYNLAILYYQGQGVSRSDAQAYKWLYVASQKGEPRAQDMLPVAERNLSAELKAQVMAELQKPQKLLAAADTATYAF